MTLAVAAQAASILGALLALFGYWLIGTGRLSGRAPAYHALNLVAGVFLTFSSVVILNFGNILLNVVWMSMAVIMLARPPKNDPPRVPVARGPAAGA